MKMNAGSIRPPLHPLFEMVSQSISCCSDNDTSCPVLIAFIPSTATTVENAQQPPVIRGN